MIVDGYISLLSGLLTEQRRNTGLLTERGLRLLDTCYRSHDLTLDHRAVLRSALMPCRAALAASLYPESMARWKAALAPSTSPRSASRDPRVTALAGAATACPDSIARWKAVLAPSTSPFHLCSPGEIEDLLDGPGAHSPGLLPVSRWRPG